MTLSVRTTSAEATRAVGRAFADVVLQSNIEHALVIALSGELGAGKTTFVSGILNALGVQGSVRSPTYTLIEPYELANRAVYHLDLYRLTAPTDLEMLAPRDLLEPRAVLLVEWAERAGKFLPKADVSITLQYPSTPLNANANNEQRTIEFQFATPGGKNLAALLEAIPDMPFVPS